ncbi:MAG TPA: O-antigen ligase family protein [Sumerlaeia bacterium]|nr:O-antigen ligase family protein [Sumerlaeia bacterium]
MAARRKRVLSGSRNGRLDTCLARARGVAILLALAGAPLIFAPFAYEQFVLPKMVWVCALAIFLTVLAALRALAGTRVHLALHGINLLVLLFFLWHLMLIPLASSRSLAWDRVGWLFVVLIVSWGWQEWATGRRRRILWAVWCLAAAVALAAGWALYQDLLSKWGPLIPGWLQPRNAPVNRLGDWRGWISSGFGNTDHIAAFLATLYLPLVLLYLHQKGRIGATVLLAALWASAAALIVCWSVGANASLILAAFVLLVGMGHRRRRLLWRPGFRRRLLAWLGGCVLLVLWLVANTPLNPHRPGIFQEAFASERWIEGGPTRGIIWLNALEMIRRRQIFGVGPGCFSYVYPSIQSAFVPQEESWLRYQGLYTNAAHNSILQTWAELGPLGAFLLAAICVAAFRALARATRQGSPLDGWIAWGGIAALTTLCATSMMTFPLQLPVSTLLFFALLPLGRMLAGRAGERGGVPGAAAPSLISQGRWGEWALFLEDMRRPTAFSVACNLSRGPRIVLGAAVVCACALWMIHAVRPLVSDAVYRQARDARAQGDLRIASARRASPQISDAAAPGTGLDAESHYARADRLFRRALTIYPNHTDCRSAYSDFLLARGRYEECVKQLAVVFERLDSSELYLRRGRALEGLGREYEARRDFATYRRRRPILDLPQQGEVE